MIRNKLLTAYKRLKSDLYYDKTWLSQRETLIAFESRADSLDEAIALIADVLAGDETTWAEFMENRLGSIETLPFPKKLKERKDKTVIVNDRKSDIELEELQYFFHSDAETLLIGALWTMEVGPVFEKEEALSLGKPVLVMRDTTERPEGVAAGTLRLVGTDEQVIYNACRELLTNDAAYAAMAQASNSYGDGHASERIANVLVGALGGRKRKLKTSDI